MKIGNFELSPPKEAYSFFPPSALCLIETEFFVERLIFSKQEFKEWEKVVLEQLDKYMARQGLVIPDNTVKLRFLYGQGWNIPQAFEALKYDIKWKKEWPPCKTLIPLLTPILNSGGVYLHGRDTNFRPALIIRPNFLTEFPYHLHLAVAYFLLEFILETMLIPGQVENWVMIIDLDHFTIGDLTSYQKLISELFTHYPCRLGKVYLVRGGKSIHGLNKILPPNTLYKLSIVQNTEELLNDFASDQLEMRFGGIANDLRQYWPPLLMSPGGKTDSLHEQFSGQSYREYLPSNTKLYSDLSSLKASHAGEKESFISNNDFRDEIWQRLELVSESYSFMNLEHLKTQENEEKKKKGKRNMIIEEMSSASTREPKAAIREESEFPFICNFCNGDCMIW